MAKKTAKKNNISIAPEKMKLIVVAVVAILVGAVGTYMVTRSSAAIISGTASNCGSAYDGFYVRNITYKNGLKNSDSVRNLAKYLCERNYLSANNAVKINKSGNWSQTLSKSISSLELSDARLSATADGLPDLKMICVLSEYKHVGIDGKTYANYHVPYPVGYGTNAWDECYGALGTERDPNGK